jgi:hypothetical protein
MPIVEWVGRQRNSEISTDGKIIAVPAASWTEKDRTFSFSRPGPKSLGSPV